MVEIMETLERGTVIAKEMNRFTNYKHSLLGGTVTDGVIEVCQVPYTQGESQGA